MKKKIKKRSYFKNMILPVLLEYALEIISFALGMYEGIDAYLRYYNSLSFRARIIDSVMVIVIYTIIYYGILRMGMYITYLIEKKKLFVLKKNFFRKNAGSINMVPVYTRRSKDKKQSQNAKCLLECWRTNIRETQYKKRYPIVTATTHEIVVNLLMKEILDADGKHEFTMEKSNKIKNLKEGNKLIFSSNEIKVTITAYGKGRNQCAKYEYKWKGTGLFTKRCEGYWKKVLKPTHLYYVELEFLPPFYAKITQN